MKKFFIALSVLAALILGVAPAQALVGMPDDMPGENAVVPFICNSNLAGLNTVILFYDTAGGWPALAGGNPVAKWHYTVYDKDSNTVFDDNITGTPWDLNSADAITIINSMAPAARAALEMVIDGITYYAGYIYFDAINTVTANTTAGQFMFLDLTAGKASAANIPMKEQANLLVPAAFQLAMVNQDATSEDVNMELFSPNALEAAINLQAGAVVPVNATFFSLFPRFYILDANANTFWIFWNSVDGAPGTLHLDWYDTAENTASSNITINDELVIIDVEPLLPAAVWPTTTYPKEGFLNLTWATNTAALRGMETLGWSYLIATGGAAESWNALTPMVRNVLP